MAKKPQGGASDAPPPAEIGLKGIKKCPCINLSVIRPFINAKGAYNYSSYLLHFIAIFGMFNALENDIVHFWVTL